MPNVEANRFAQLETWEFDQRRTLLSELEALRRLSLLMSELDEYLRSFPHRPLVEINSRSVPLASAAPFTSSSERFK
jgi:hypothetical protein